MSIHGYPKFIFFVSEEQMTCAEKIDKCVLKNRGTKGGRHRSRELNWIGHNCT
jgi:hypothetical protein